MSLYLDQFTTLYDTSTGGLFTGAAYADVNAVIPGRLILAVCALLVAALFIVTAVIGRWRLPLDRHGAARRRLDRRRIRVPVGAVEPAGEAERGRPRADLHQERDHRDAGRLRPLGREADRLQREDHRPGRARSAPTRRRPRTSGSSTRPSSRRRSGSSSSSSSTTSSRPYLDVDRYSIDGTSQDAVVAVRELNQGGLQTPSAYNNTFVYTHGYGLVAAYGNQRTQRRRALVLRVEHPGPGSARHPAAGHLLRRGVARRSRWSAPRRARSRSSSTTSAATQANGTQNNTTYDATGAGEGGPNIGNLFNRLVYALKFSSDQILLSGAVNANSQILYDRNPIDRVQKVAPYLTLDSDPYPTVVNGRIVWIVDGYTTSSSYPYSASESLSDALSNSNTNTEATYATDQINYIRNSVKATVDAYTGKVTLYAWDASDPVLKAWRSVFPSTVAADVGHERRAHQPRPVPGGHVPGAAGDPRPVPRHRPDLLVPGRRPVADAARTRRRPSRRRTTRAAAAVLPDDAAAGQTSPTFSLYSTYIPDVEHDATRAGALTGYLAVDADAGSHAGHEAHRTTASCGSSCCRATPSCPGRRRCRTSSSPIRRSSRS